MNHHALALVVIFTGGGIGSAARHLVNQICAAAFGSNPGWGTLVVNIVGSFLMGVLAGWFSLRNDGGQLLRLFLTTGFLGGFTTFSAFSLDAVLLFQRGQIGPAILYIGASVLISLLGLLGGLALMRM